MMGGGFRALAVDAGVVAALIVWKKQTTLKEAFADTDMLSTVSGSTWFMSSLVYSRSFAEMIEKMGEKAFKAGSKEAKKLEGKLAQVSEFLAQQSVQAEKLEQLRAENSMHEKQLSARRIADLEARLGARDFMEQSADQSADSKYRKLYRDEMRARERAESQLRRQEQMSLDLQHRVDRERATRLQYQPMTYNASFSPMKSLPQSLNRTIEPHNSTKPLTSTRRGSNSTMANGVYSRMNDVVSRAAAEPLSRASPLQRI